MSRAARRLSLILFGACLIAGLGAEDCRAADPPTLRIWLAGLPAEPSIACEKACSILPRRGKTHGRLLVKLEPSKAAPIEGGFRLGADRYLCEALDVVPDGGAAIRIDGKAYRGAIRLLRAGQRLAVINWIDAESYLLGVLGSEMPASWPAEALKAQAVAARTYALYYRQDRAGMAWDMTSTVEDQMYKGGVAPKSVRAAVAGTRGQVLLHQGKLFPAFFHSTCGGRTEKPGLALDMPEFDFVGGVKCGFCKDAPRYRWRASLGEKEIVRRLAAAGISAKPPIEDISVIVSKDKPGRQVRVTSAEATVDVPIVEFRRAVGRLEVMSGKFECLKIGDRFVFTGRGLGHGAGMCQYGARGMARAKRSYAEILAHYYPNTALKTLY